MPVQKANTEMVGLLEPYMLRRNEFYEDPARLLSATLMAQRGGGTNQMYGWLANSRQLYGQGATVTEGWTQSSIVTANWGLTANGAPYLTLDGAADYLSAADAGWNEVGANPFVVWHWVNTDTIVDGAEHAITGKLLAEPGVSWGLYQGIGPVAWRFVVNNTGMYVNNIEVASSHTIVAGAWTFVGAFYQPGTRIRIYAGHPDDAALTVDQNVVGIPASLYNGAALLQIGANSDPGWYWDGKIAGGGAWYGPTYPAVDGYMARVFQMTRWFYEA